MSSHADPFTALAEHAPQMWCRFGGFNQTVLEGDTAIDKKTKELIAIGVALTTQCDGCLEAHSAAAVAAGATPAELAETIHVAAALRAGGAFVHGMRHVMPAISAAAPE
ncbi:carboxymuconolactone decarboxylase family protein [Kineosporia succinea]|uniref:AhpD family alkylhydroperoxidase n=1 Tax=Kineosporia succinea TaxID=84632 RepID=A0ABT9PA17_9ACTN|nr:carboxymuconolactone decarboxylase family protein [Kineosporia succinea]MDP9829538.1 AhpD family alkylhydroperoxidase [Kineosporia succinea]